MTFRKFDFSKKRFASIRERERALNAAARFYQPNFGMHAGKIENPIAFEYSVQEEVELDDPQTFAHSQGVNFKPSTEENENG